MARSDDDIFEITGGLMFRLSLDRERLQADPVWRQLEIIYNDPASTFQAYLEHYIARDRFLRDMPSTNGPGQLSLIYSESRENGDSSNSADHA